MKTGAEIHFIAGQLFTLGILAIAVLPRLPHDVGCGVGGRQSHRFRKALIGLVCFTTLRTALFHFRDISGALVIVDGALGTIHVVGQSFLCMSTAYLLQTRLVNVVNISGQVPGRSLVPKLGAVLLLTVLGSIGSSAKSPNLWCLVNLAEAISCQPVIQTLRQYTAVSFVGNGRRPSILQGPIITQMLLVCEYWYLVTSVLNFLAEATDHAALVDRDTPLALLLAAIRHNQDNGINDWTRLLLHAVFQNSLDELQSVQQPGSAFQEDSAESDVEAASEISTGIVRRRGRVGLV